MTCILGDDYRVNVNNALDQHFPNFLGDETILFSKHLWNTDVLWLPIYQIEVRKKI